ncbi:MAG: fibronectin type III domain-containing protein, partial [Chloroflexi bacterium]|nr:fibronectin type III domain-containing protein [Chloroflexota bacterium]
MKRFLVSVLSVISVLGLTIPMSLPVAAAVQTAPSGLTATAASASQVNLAWTDNSDNETSFRIERSLDNFLTAPSANLTASANAVSLSDTTVSQPNTYYYRVVAVNGADDSTPSNVAAVKVDVPSAPSNLSATIMSATRVDLIWTDRSNDETGFRIERSLDGFATAPSATFNAAANARTLTDSTVSANNTYSYRVIAVNALGGSTASNVATVKVTNKIQAGPIDPAFIFNGDPNTSFPGYYQDDQGTRVALLPGEPGQAIDPPDPNNPYQVFLNMGEEGFYFLAESGFADMDGTGPGGKLVTVFATEANVDVPGTEVVFGRIRIFAQVPAAGVYLFQHPWGEDTIEVTQEDVDAKRGIRFTEDIGLAERTFNLVGNSRINRFLRQTVPPPPTGWIGDGVT